MHSKSAQRFATLLIILASTATTAATIEVWTRTPGNYTDVETPISHRPEVVKIPTGKPMTLMDPQTKKKATYRASPLTSISTMKGAALLHFKNGMVIPIDMVKQGKKIFIATAIRINKKWSSTFPSVAKPDQSHQRDPRPITFEGNKLICEGCWTTKGFNPWPHVDSLTGIESVEIDRYYDQFHAAKAHAKGKDVYLRRCQYCHGLRRVGARYGWDFLGPLPIHKKRDTKSLHNHVKNKKQYGFEMGLMMPQQKDFTKEESEALHGWLESLKQKDLKSYLQ